MDREETGIGIAGRMPGFRSDRPGSARFQRTSAVAAVATCPQPVEGCRAPAPDAGTRRSAKVRHLRHVVIVFVKLLVHSMLRQ